MSTVSSPPPTLHKTHRDLVFARFGEAVWLALTSLHSLEDLPGALFRDVAEIVRRLGLRHMVLAGGTLRQAPSLQFPRAGGFEGFQVEVAGEVVCHLEGRLGRVNDLDLITRILPAALGATLERRLHPEAPTAMPDYRLAGLPIGFTPETIPIY